MTAYYNETDTFAADWLEALIAAGHIADGKVDRRSIKDVVPNDVKGFAQCHFFAGIGVWSYALRQAGWPDDLPVWTGSCPCQPFSQAGKRKGFADERHLWPEFFRLIREQRPDTIFGEQTAGKDGRTWLDLVSTDLEGEDYAVGAAATVACGFGAPHKRQRLYFVADAQRGAAERRRLEVGGETKSGEGKTREQRLRDDTGDGELTSIVGDTPIGGDGTLHGEPGPGVPAQEPNRGPGLSGVMGDSDDPRLEGREAGERPDEQPVGAGGVGSGPGPTNGVWRDADWLFCRDGKWRPVEPGSFPLVAGTPGRVGRLRGYGNALVAPQAQGFIEAYMEIA